MLTRDQILDLPAGRELDALIAEHCSGDSAWKGLARNLARRPQIYNYHYPRYSTTIAAAWPLAAGKGWILYENKWNDVNAWFIFLEERDMADWLPLGCAPTIELAICRAALAAHFLGAKDSPSPSAPTTDKPAAL
jgi:hypothetical protein